MAVTWGGSMGLIHLRALLSSRVSTAREYVREILRHPAVPHIKIWLSFISLSVAAYLFSLEMKPVAIAVLILAFAFVFLLLFSWIQEEATRRKILYGDSMPTADHDAYNHDLRDEVVSTCLALLLVTPLLLQILNRDHLHYEVSPDHLGLRELFCGESVGEICTPSAPIWEIPSWTLFTVKAFVQTLPGGDELEQVGANVTGVKASNLTPTYPAYVLKALFVGFLGTVVWGQFQAVGRGIKDAVLALKFSPLYAAGLGPIALDAIKTELLKGDGSRHQNATIAVGEIARRYPGTNAYIRDQFEEYFIGELNSLDLRVPASHDKLRAVSSTLCQMGSEVGVHEISRKIIQTQRCVRGRKVLVKSLLENLDDENKMMVLENLRNSEIATPDTQIRDLIDASIAELSESQVDAPTEPA
jgi:hypothetical protein